MSLALHSFTGASRFSLYPFSMRGQRLRRFCSTVPRSRPYLVWAPDYTDDEALARRMAVRPRHFITANKHIKQGILKVAGGLITPESQDASLADKKFFGSVLLYEADSIEDVRKLVEQDIYWTGNVWDKEKLMILPTLMATALQDKIAGGSNDAQGLEY